MSELKGKIIQIIGPVVDIEFDGTHLPKNYNAIRIPRTSTEGKKEDLIVEVQQHLGEDRVRTVAMDSTDGCLLYTSPSPRDRTRYRMPSSA